MWVAGYQKEQPRLGVCDEVVEAVDTVVPRSIRDKKGMGILNNDEPRSISARGGIGPAVGIGRRRMRNGERPMKARACGSMWSRLFFTAKTLGAP